ncbi:MAG: (2Fe-2S)-binding protein [Kiloniellales bacterium]
MFKRLEAAAPEAVPITYEGREILARPGDSLAAALLAAGVLDLRDTPVSGAPRSPYCMMGVCFDCLVEVDGLANCQACMTPVAAGMVVRRQDGAAQLQIDEVRDGD